MHGADLRMDGEASASAAASPAVASPPGVATGSAAAASSGMPSQYITSSCSSSPLPVVGGSSSSWTFHGVGAAAFGEMALLEQSPAARSNKAPSEPPSEFSSWHDDASSSLATFSAGGRARTITVNTQRVRMGEHLKGKLEGMITQRFENYLRIIQTLQNDIGKLAALECELRIPSGRSGCTSAARTSISCNEDGTFLVYTVPDVSATVAGSNVESSGASAVPSDAEGVVSAEDGSKASMDVSPEAPVEGRAAAVSSTATPSAVAATRTVAQGTSATASSSKTPVVATRATATASSGVPMTGNDGDAGSRSSEVLRRWVEQVCEFGMSGRCYSLTALFHFGYTAWKQLLGDGRDAVSRSLSGGVVKNGTPGQIAEEEDTSRGKEDMPGACWSFAEEDAAMPSTPVMASKVPRTEVVAASSPVGIEDHAAMASSTVGPAAGPPPPSSSCEGSSPAVVATTAPPPVGAEELPNDSGCCGPNATPVPEVVSQPPASTEMLPLRPTARVDAVGSVLEAARLAADCEQNRQALELCGEGILLARGSSAGILGPRVRRVSTPDASAASSLRAAGTAPLSDSAGGSASASSSAAAGPLMFPASSTSPASGSHVPLTWSGGARGASSSSACADSGENTEEVTVLLWQLLSLRASVQVRLRRFAAALQDAEELISLQPTCAEGYYWQSVALQGMDHAQEALEALMSALEYEPQNPLFQQAFTLLFEEISTASAETPSALPAASGGGHRGGGVHRMSRSAGSSGAVLHRRSRVGPVGDALSTTTQATHLSSRSTTPTEVSAPLSRSSSDDDLYAMGAVFEDHT